MKAWLKCVGKFSVAGLLLVLFSNILVSAPATAELTKTEKSVHPQQELVEAYKLYFNDPVQLQRIGYKFEKQGIYEQAIAIYQDIVNRFPKYRNRLYLKDLLIGLRHDLNSDYFATQAQEASAKSKEQLAILKSKLPEHEFLQFRAASFASRMPLKVFIHSAKGCRGYRPELHEILIKSMDEWTKASAGKVRFKVVDSAKNADIDCFWTDKKGDLHNESAAGITSYVNVGHSKIYILTMLHGIPVDRRFARHICIHEIGHALGLSHSRDPKDVMRGFYLDTASTPVQISATDRSRIIKMYSDEYIEEARRKARPFVDSNIAYASYLSRTANRSLALKAIDDAIAYDQMNVKAWLTRSGINVRLYQYDNAIKDLSVVEKLDPANKRVIFGQRALINVFRRHYEDARTDFAGAIEAGYINPSVYAGLAITKVLTRLDVDILKNLDEAIARNQHDSNLDKVRSLVCFLEGDTKSAIESSNCYFAKNNWHDKDAIEQALLSYFWNKQTGNEGTAAAILTDAEMHAKTAKWKTLISFIKGEITEHQLKQEISTTDDTIDMRLWNSLIQVNPGEELNSKDIVQSIDEKLCDILSKICWQQFYNAELLTAPPGEKQKRSNNESQDSNESPHEDEPQIDDQ